MSARDPHDSSRGRAWEAYFTTWSRLADRMERELKAAAGLSLPEYNVLLQVHRAGEDGIRPSVLAREVVFSPSRLTHTLHRLGDRGLLLRRECATDARGGLISLTPSGEEHFATAAQVHRALVRRLVLDDLGEDEAAVLRRVFSRIGAALDAEDGA